MTFGHFLVNTNPHEHRPSFSSRMTFLKLELEISLLVLKVSQKEFRTDLFLGYQISDGKNISHYVGNMMSVSYQAKLCDVYSIHIFVISNNRRSVCDETVYSIVEYAEN